MGQHGGGHRPTGTINCFPTTQSPTQATRPFRALPEAHHYIPIVTKPSLPQFSGRRPFVVDLLLGFSPWPILWQTWLDQLSESGSQVFSHYNLGATQLPHCLRANLGLPRTSFASWASWSQSLLVLDGSKIGRTASNPFSSPRSETLPTLVFDWPECSSFTHFRCPLTPTLPKSLCAHFASCIEPLILLAHQATPLSTFLRAEIWHEFCGNYFLPEFTHFIPLLQSYVPSQGMHTVWKHKHSNVFAKKRPSWRANQRPEIILFSWLSLAPPFCSLL